MKTGARFLAAILLLACAPMALADVVELKGEGYINGQVLSEDEQFIQFKDAHGVVRRLERGVVISVIKEEGAGRQPLPRFLTEWIRKIKRRLSSFFSNKKPLWDKFLLPKPSERTVVFKETEAVKRMNQTFDGINRGLATSQKARAAQARRQKKAMEGYGGEGPSASSENRPSYRSF